MDNKSETERALRVLTCTFCKDGLPLVLPKLHERADGQKFRCESKHEKLLPLLNAAVEQATMQEHANHTQFASDMYSTLIDPCATGSMKESDIWAACLKAARDNRQALYDAQNMVAGAYAAAAKRASEVINGIIESGTDVVAELNEQILALTPANARQASQQLERMACGHLKADEQEYFICCDVWSSDHKTHTNPIEQAIGSMFKCRTCAAIASAEARARLEELEEISSRYMEKGYREPGIISTRRIELEAAASTPDRPTAVDGTCCSCGYSGEDETPCPKQEDGHHCIHWYEGESPDSTKEKS